MKTVTLGGDRLGSGKKQKVDLHGFERSTHDLGYVWRNTQAPGTLVPFMTMLALPGDTFDIELQADVKTHPTLGPLFASFKLQLDVFECPIRLYHGWLHNNKLKIGNDMSNVKLPIISLNANPLVFNVDEVNSTNNNKFVPPLEFQQINQSSILSYLGTRGVGQATWNNVERTINAIPLLGYWDIYKNYYANKQEEIGIVIHNDVSLSYMDNFAIKVYEQPAPFFTGNFINIHQSIPASAEWEFTIDILQEDEPQKLFMIYEDNDVPNVMNNVEVTITSTPITGGYRLTWYYDWDVLPNGGILWGITLDPNQTLNTEINSIKLTQFPLEYIDTVREEILSHLNTDPYEISASTWDPYGLPLQKLANAFSTGEMCLVCSQEGLGIKTYQSDIFNNWLNTEWIDGAGGINEITAVSTAGESFDINSLNLAQKVYDMLNRIAVSGGTYEDWLSAVYDHESFRRCETPMYHGGLSKEIVFQEVISQAGAWDGPENFYQPLGQLAGRGVLSNKHKGGKISIKVNEPSFLIGIVSITPRIDYYQGNDFFTNHKTINDLHKPSLDEIGFQDLVTDKLTFWDTTTENDVQAFKSAGKQPAWLDYMTNFNRLHGNFADERSEMYMTLARRYEPDSRNKTIQDLTTYIDPTKFNYAFAQTDLTAMNFWVQIGVDCIARRKMSAKLMPNL
jgi:hypothetical protein